MKASTKSELAKTMLRKSGICPLANSKTMAMDAMSIPYAHSVIPLIDFGYVLDTVNRISVMANPVILETIKVVAAKFIMLVLVLQTS